MKYYPIPLVLIVVVSIFCAGCMQTSGTGPVSPPALVTTVPPQNPATPVVTAAETSLPGQVVTVIHQVSQLKDIKDTELLFTLQVPVEWTVTTQRLSNPDNYEGLVYQTDLVPDNMFTIYTYTASRSQDQAYRDQFRKWSPAPAETTVTINEITYDRFESASNGRISVAYVARKSSANERGYASVLVFAADAGNRFEKEDFEKIVASFHYFPSSVAGTMPGTEIERVLSNAGSSGSVRSRTGSGDAGAASGGSSGGCSSCGG